MTDHTKLTDTGSRPFTASERVVVETLLARHPHIMLAADVVEAAWRNGRGNTYDQTFRALQNLLKRGTVVKPKRGAYRLATEADQ